MPDEQTDNRCRVTLLGSCVARDTIELAAPDSYELVEFIARQSLASAFGPKRSSWSQDPLAGLTSPWQRRSAQRDLTGDYARLLSNAAAVDLILMDLVDERGGIGLLPDGSVFTRSLEVTRSGLLSSLPDVRSIPFGSDEHFRLWLDGFDKLLGILRDQGSAQKLVVLDHHWAISSVEGFEAPYGESNLDPRRINEALSRYIEHIRARGVATLKVPDELCIASGSHRWGLAPFHYVDEFYRYVLRELSQHGFSLSVRPPDNTQYPQHVLPGDVVLTGPSVDDHIYRQIVMSEDFYEAELLRATAPFVNPGDLVVDVGANIGNHSVYWASQRQACVMAFEPYPISVAVLARNVEVNALEGRVFVRAHALGNAPTHATVSSTDPTNTGATKFSQGSKEGTVVRTLDASLGSVKRKLRLLKVDVEGAEADVLKGAMDRLRKDRPVVVVEAQDDRSLRAVRAILDSVDYHMAEVFNATPTYLFLPGDFKYCDSYSRLDHASDAMARLSQRSNAIQNQLAIINRRVGNLENKFRDLQRDPATKFT